MGDSSQLTSIKNLFNRISSNKKLHLTRRWNYIQRSYKLDDLLVIDFEDSEFQEMYWRCHFNNPHAINTARRRFNLTLEANFYGKAYTDGEVSAVFKSSIEKERWLGFFMPRPKWSEESVGQSEKTIVKLQLIKKYFDFRLFLENVYKQNPTLETNEQRILNTIWLYGLSYKEFLANIHHNKFGGEDFKDFWYLSILDIENFETLLPSEQLVSLIFLAYESIYSVEISNLLNTLVKEATPDVGAYFTKHEKIFLDPGIVSKEVYQSAFEEFLNVSIWDTNQLYLDELLNNRSKNNHLALYPKEIRTYFNPENDSTIGNTIKIIIGRMNIFDRVNKNILKQKVNRSNLSPPARESYVKNSIRWHDVRIKEELLECRTKYIETRYQKILEVDIQEHWRNHLVNLGNAITCPFFRVEKSNEKLYFQWNTMQRSQEHVFVTDYKSKALEEQEEDRKCGMHLEHVRKLYSLDDAISFAKRIPEFSFLHIQERWEKEIRVLLEEIRRKSAKRIRRMKEFGILTGNEKPNPKMHIYLNELLAIEEEVKPYLTFVKQAFQSALPVKKMTHFDPYRNSHVGVEFDPETVFDQNKWQRGEVMKVLKRKKVYGNVQQINTFCLDFSGSMTHNRMRNLFKILFLIITGLEDRKIYNSVHFFNEKFIPGVEFSLQYTNRKILFKVLSQISQTVPIEGRIVYLGMGGTNIYAGLKKCYERIVSFSEEISVKSKAEGITKSIFVISDGEPTLGITDIPELADIIRCMRKEGDVSIKGIYIKPENDTSTFIPKLFGEGHYVENTNFEEGIRNFVSIMTRTFEAQRKEFKMKKKVNKVFGAKGLKR